LHQKTDAVIRIYNLLGSKVDEMIFKVEHPGTRQITWSPSRNHANLPSGIYIIRLDLTGDGLYESKTKQVFYSK
jgi:hypothetical protein